MPCNGKNKPGHYKIFGTPWRKEGGRTGNWEISSGKNGKIIYQLKDDKGNGFLYLLQLDENILVFTDKEGNLLVGDQDFSYTLNRINVILDFLKKAKGPEGPLMFAVLIKIICGCLQNRFRIPAILLLYSQT